MSEGIISSFHPLPTLEIYDFEAILEAGFLNTVLKYFRSTSIQTLMGKQVLFVYADGDRTPRLQMEWDATLEQKLDAVRIMMCPLTKSET